MEHDYLHNMDKTVLGILRADDALHQLVKNESKVTAARLLIAPRGSPLTRAHTLWRLFRVHIRPHFVGAVKAAG